MEKEIILNSEEGIDFKSTRKIFSQRMMMENVSEIIYGDLVFVN